MFLTLAKVVAIIPEGEKMQKKNKKVKVEDIAYKSGRKNTED